MKDPDRLIKVERAIAKLYGEETTANPHAFWDKEKEIHFFSEIKKIEEKRINSQHYNEKVDVDGVLIPKKLVTAKETSSRTCVICNTYSFKLKDDLYMYKFGCCFKCFIQHVEGRESKWQEKKKNLIANSLKD